ncbi:hypothetical protein PYW08_009249 [Mythimna loreyi]|uniref:Uncharacterized protein n=1 Tax=Mythimna loreyi TaxID=667449 RepID=A0ACC2Q874_9NEOP|nr:hypothetical protein PYW08_009249 [Mythimna loreyi]
MNRLCIALLLAVATATVVSYAEPEVFAVPDDAEQDRRGTPLSADNLSLGTIGDTDRVIGWINYSVGSSFFVTHDQEITVRGFDYTNITAIRVTRVANSPRAYPSILAGGLGQNDVTIRLLGTREQGFEYIIQVYASVGC